MSLLTKIALGIGAVIIVVGSTLVIIAALFSPKEYKGEGPTDKQDTWDQSLEDV